MNSLCLSLPRRGITWSWPRLLVIGVWMGGVFFGSGARIEAIEVGLATRDVTPIDPIWLAGYASRNHASERVDTPLLAVAVAIQSSPKDRVVLVSLDNCEVSREFTQPVLATVQERHNLQLGQVMIISSHTHSGPVLEGPLMGMSTLKEADQATIAHYGQFLRQQLIEVVSAALLDVQPALLEHGTGRTTFAMNRRVYQDDKVVFGENLDGPVDWDVPVLKISGTNRQVRAILFGYACHGTTITGEDFYAVSGDYMAYARQYLQELYPKSVPAYLTGMGADANPSPRTSLLDARRHGLALAGAVSAVLNRPMRPVEGPLRFAYAEAKLPLATPPAREQLEKDEKSTDPAVRHRASRYLSLLNKGQELPQFVTLPLGVVRLGEDLMFAAMGGEVVVDYAVRFKRLFAGDHPWLIGYAYDVPCYIPSIRILKEGGYEADSSLVYYGLYGPLRTRTEEILIGTMTDLVRQTRLR